MRLIVAARIEDQLPDQLTVLGDHPTCPADRGQAHRIELPKEDIYLVADGYGIKIRVWHRQLIVEDGFGRDRRRRTFARATSRLRRLVLLGHTGYVTLEAINWLNGIGAALVQIDKDGRLLLTSSVVGRDHAGLRRAQARAAGTEAGLEISRRLLVRKLAGQVETLRALGIQSAGDELRPFEARAQIGDSLDGILAAEASGAKTYWEALAAFPVRFGFNSGGPRRFAWDSRCDVHSYRARPGR
jgi:CRISPR/Cas system-associated endonuclease Cas1